MFEALMNDRTSKRGRRFGVLAGLSVAIHVLAVFGLLIRSAWAIEKLTVPRADIVVAPPFTGSPPSPPAGGEPKAATERPAKPKAARKAAAARRQEISDHTPPAAESPVGSGDGDGSAGDGAGEGTGSGGNGLGFGPGSGLGIEGLGDGLSGPPPEPERVDIVPPTAVRGLRIAGDDQIRPPNSALIDMQRAGESKVVATTKLCLSASGRVQSVSMLKSSGYRDWDQAITSRMRAWRYRPYRIGGKATAVCTSVTFVYEP